MAGTEELVDAAMAALRRDESDVAGVLMVDDGGLLVIAARGELANELMEVADERIRRVKRSPASPAKR